MNKIYMGIILTMISVYGYADEKPVLATASFVQSAYNQLETQIATKQGTLTAGNNITINGNTISATDTNTTYNTGTSSTSGITKLYTGTGNATDGTITQNAITSELSNKQDKLPMATRPTSGKYNVVWDGDVGRFVFEEQPARLLQCDAAQGLYNIGFDQCVNSNINPETYDYDASSMSWSVELSLGHIEGIATCTKTSGTAGEITNEEYTISTGEEICDYGGGLHCWCKMMTPEKSRWVYAIGFAPFRACSCASNCASYCGSFVQSDAIVRSGVFGSVGQ